MADIIRKLVPQGSVVFNKSITIGDGEQNSAVIELDGSSLVGVLFPASLTSTAMTFLVSSAADGTFVDLKSTTSGSALSYTVASSQYNAIDPAPFAGVQFLKIRLGSAESGAKELLLSLKGI